MPRALYGSRSIRSIFPDRVAPPRSSPRCSSGAERSQPKENPNNGGHAGRGPAQLGVGPAVDRPGVEQPLDEPRRRAVGETLELRDVERLLRAQLLQHAGMNEPRRPPKGFERPLEPPPPAIPRPGRL